MNKHLLLTLTLTAAWAAALAQIPTDGLMAHYPFNGDALDASGNEHHGTVNGALPTDDRDGRSQSAYLFDGTNDYIDLGDWENGGAMSFAFWARWDAFHNYSRIVDLGNGSSSNNIIVANYQTNNNLFFSVYTSGENKYFVPAIELGQWAFFAATVDNSGVMTVYKDGVQIGHKPNGSTPNTLMRTAQYVGRSNFSQDGYFMGAIDELRIYGRTLSETEILAIYEAETCSTASSLTETACDSYTAPDGNVYTASGIVTAVIPNAAGCDSTITIDLTIHTVNIAVSQDRETLTADAADATYQWLDCEADNAPMDGETGQSFLAVRNGNYAVEIGQNGCIDTSACYQVSTVGFLENTFETDVTVFPNPTNGQVTIRFGTSLPEFSATLSDLNGKVIRTSTHRNTDSFEWNVPEPSGVYLLTIASDTNIASVRLVKR
ncbi:MAG: LamG-like jellyroll fold domain-containing protein [Bacteroidales bacterium]